MIHYGGPHLGSELLLERRTRGASADDALEGAGGVADGGEQGVELVDVEVAHEHLRVPHLVPAVSDVQWEQWAQGDWIREMSSQR